MFKMTHVSKVYQTEYVATHALRDLEIHVRRGEFVAVTGPSGAGKTTFLKIAGMLETPSSGLYQLDGIEVGSLSDNERSRIRNQKIGFIFQTFNLLPDISIQANVELPFCYRGVGARERRLRATVALDRVGLTSRANHYPSQLSGGQQQRAAIARALAGSPSILLADEPTGNLDVETGEGIAALIEELHREGTTVVMVTHDAALASRAGRRLHILDGHLVDITDHSEEAAMQGEPA